MKDQTVLKNLFFILFMIMLTACSHREENSKKLDEAYSRLFNKEYPELQQSGKVKAFMQQYDSLLAITKRIDLADSVATDTLVELGELCFLSEKAFDAQYKEFEANEKAIQTGEIRLTPFKSYPDYSAEIDALRLDLNFYKDPEKHLGEYGSDMHRVRSMVKDRRKFEEEYNYSPRSKYEEFRALMIKMNELAHCKYLLMVKELLAKEGKMTYEAGSTGVFEPGYRLGMLYLYDLSLGKVVRRWPVVATNSDNLTFRESESGNEALHDDLKRNYDSEVGKTITENVKVKGNIP